MIEIVILWDITSSRLASPCFGTFGASIPTLLARDHR